MAEGFKLLLVPEDQVRITRDGRAGIVEFSTGWERLVGPFDLVADIPPGGCIRMSRLLYDTIEVVDG